MVPESETCNQSDDETWHGQEKYKDNDDNEYNEENEDYERTTPKSDPRDLWPLSLKVWDTPHISVN